VEELHALLAEADVGPPYVLVGHSMGGVYARLYANAYPEEVVGMVLVDSGHGEEDLRFPEAVVKLRNRGYGTMAFSLRLLKALNAIGLPLLPSGKAEGGWPSPIPEAVRETYLGVIFSDTRHFEAASQETASIGASFAAARSASATDLGDMPLVVLSLPNPAADLGKLVSAEDAEQFRVVSDQLQNELAALSSNGRRVNVADSGHYIQIDQPEAVVSAVRSVIEDAGR
jgi:pimeloyl-ACP methyl ester carboxylesterase